MESFLRWVDGVDRRIARFMHQWGEPALRISFGVIFFWFGILKPLGVSAAEPIVLSTVQWLPFLSPTAWLGVIGWWEVCIGILFLFKRTTRIAIALLFLQMVGTFMPLVVLREVSFQEGRFPFAPSMEGQYIIKNLMIMSAALVIGGNVRKDIADDSSN